ncbi:MAG: hypothetical protein AAF587_29495 [Bacteroidota bacterium]
MQIPDNIKTRLDELFTQEKIMTDILDSTEDYLETASEFFNELVDIINCIGILPDNEIITLLEEF